MVFLCCRCECVESFSFDLNESFMLQWATLNSDSNRLTHPNSIVLRHVLAMWPCCDMKWIGENNHIRSHPLLRTSLMDMKKISHLSSHAAVWEHPSTYLRDMFLFLWNTTRWTSARSSLRTRLMIWLRTRPAGPKWDLPKGFGFMCIRGSCRCR